MRIVILASILLLAFTGYSQDKTAARKLDQMIQQGMKDWKIPGMAAIVVKDGQVVFSKTYGYKDLKTKAPVDENTLFNMASTTKAIIALSIGMLVDQGKLKWNDKVIDHLPSFRLSDPYVTADARIQDLLTHNLGIGNADLLWSIDSVSTEEVIRRFSNAEMVYPLRGGFTYQNIMYAIAGEVIQTVSGEHWTDFVQHNVFDRLEMTRSQAKSKGILAAGNYVTPYVDDPEDGVLKVSYTFSDQIGAAGMIWSCAKDISNYLTFLVNGGIYKGDTLIQATTFNNLFAPHSFVTREEFYPTQVLTKPHWTTYGFGWFQQDYHGTKLDFHTGSISGLVAIAGIVRDKNTAVYVFENLDHAELRHAVMFKALDLYAFNDDSRDWHQQVFQLYSGIKAQGLDARKAWGEKRISGTKPSHELASFTGTYKNKMYGTVTVIEKDGQLELDINNFLHYDLEHWHYDTFMTNKDPNYRDRFVVSFDQAADGTISILKTFGLEFMRE